MTLIVKNYPNINDFLRDILYKKIKTNLKLMEMDKYYLNSKNEYGLLTNYVLYFFNYKGNHTEKDIYNFIENLKKKIKFIKMENLTNGLLELEKKKQIILHKKHLNKKINKNIKKENITDEYIKIMIYLKERPIFDLFNYKL